MEKEWSAWIDGAVDGWQKGSGQTSPAVRHSINTWSGVHASGKPPSAATPAFRFLASRPQSQCTVDWTLDIVQND